MSLSLHRLLIFLLDSFLFVAQLLGGHHDADEKAPRFLHAWLGGASQTALGRNITGYTLLTHDDLATYDFSEECKTALTATIACATTTMHWTSPAYRGSLGNATLPGRGVRRWLRYLACLVVPTSLC